MSAEYNEEKVPPEVSCGGKRAIKAWGLQLIDQARHNYGNDGYSGTFAEAEGVRIREDLTPFANEIAASEYLEENALKWGPIVVVPYRDDEGRTQWLGGCWCSF